MIVRVLAARALGWAGKQKVLEENRETGERQAEDTRRQVRGGDILAFVG